MKIARKTSPDPVQEHLRAGKAKWNEQVRSLISHLIAFKRGINGRGDAKAGLPISDIKNPFPSQIGSFLNLLAQECSAVIDSAQGIIQEQSEYSEHRQKAKHAADESLVIEASWWGSRAWSRVSLRKLEKSVRQQRLRMIRDGADLVKMFKSLERQLLSQNVGSIPNAISQAGLLGDYVRSFMEEYDGLINAVSVLKNFGKDAPNAPEAEIEPEIPQQEPEETPATVREPLQPLLHRFNDFWSDRMFIDTVYTKLWQKPELQPNRAATEKAIDEMEAAARKFENALEMGADTETLVKLVDAAEAAYNYLLQTANNLLHTKARRFAELIKDIPNKEELLQQAMIRDQEMKKLADNALKRWFQKQWMGLNSNIQERFILDIIKFSEQARKILNEILDLLESPESTLEQIDSKTILFVREVKEILMKFNRLGDIYRLSNRRKNKSKDHYLFDINQREIKQLEDISNYLNVYLTPIEK